MKSSAKKQADCLTSADLGNNFTAFNTGYANCCPLLFHICKLLAALQHPLQMNETACMHCTGAACFDVFMLAWAAGTRE